MSALISLTKKACAIVDDEDLELVRQYRWHLHDHHNGARDLRYARSYIREKGKKRRAISMHRLILGFPDGMTVDHIDGDGLNNCRANLRLATRGQNKANSTKRQKASSKFKGVFRDGYRWRAQVHTQLAGGHKMLGSFRTEVEAAKAYDAEAKVLWGAYARLNFPEDAR